MGWSVVTVTLPGHIYFFFLHICLGLKKVDSRAALPCGAMGLSAVCDCGIS